jgi:hypothetical protein
MLQKITELLRAAGPVRHAARLTAAIALAACVLAPGTAEARNLYGAIAYSFGNGSVGWSYDHNSRGRAESDAVARCRRAGGSGCKVVIWFANSCAALAVGPRGYGSYWHVNKATAQSQAMRACAKYGSGCGIRAWSCTSR